MSVEEKYALVEDLATKHSEHLHRFLRRRVRNAADIPDIMQEAYLRLLRVPDGDTIRTPEAYIFTIAHHVAQQHALRSAVRGSGAAADEVANELSTTTSDPALEVGAQQCLHELDDALSQLAPKVRYTFLSYKRDGLSMDEISVHLGISRPMAKKYLVKALVHLRKRLAGME